MNQRSLAVLIVLNVVLLAAIALTLGPAPQQAQAQLGGGSYLMIAGNTGSAPQQVIYVMDTRTGRVAAFILDSATKKVREVGVREIADDLKGGTGRDR
ncbi:MAG: hypothetical protein AAF711_19340 [Planctomycetota bacterium]